MTTKLYKDIFQFTGKYLMLKNIFTYVSIITTIFIVRLMGPAEYGRWSLIWQLVSSIAPIASLGLLQALSKFLPQMTDPESKSSLFSKALLVVLAFFAILFPLWALGSWQFKESLAPEIYEVRFGFLILIATTSFLNLFEGYYRGLGHFSLWALLDGLRSTIATVTGVLLLVYFRHHYKSVFYSYLVWSLLFLAAFLFYHRVVIHYAGFRINAEVTKFALVLFTGQILFMIAMTMDSVLIRSLLDSTSEVAFYDVGVRIPRLVESFLLGPLTVPFLYFFSHPEYEMTKEKLIRSGTKMVSIAFGLGAMALFSLSGLIIPLLFSDVYGQSIAVLKIYCWVPFFVAFQSFAGVFFLSINKPKLPLFMGGLGLVVTFVMDMLLIPNFKSAGAASASLGGVFVVTIGILVSLAIHGINLTRIFLLLVGALGIAFALDHWVLSYSGVPVFLILIFLTQLITREEINKLISIWKFKSGT